LEEELRDLQRRLEGLDQRIVELEVEQRRQLRLIVDLSGEVVILRDQLIDHEGRILVVEGLVTDMDQRVTNLESVVLPDPNRFLRHDRYYTFELFMAQAADGPPSNELGGALGGQYNFNRWLGVTGTVLWAPHYTSTTAGPRPEDRYWSIWGFLLGGTLHLLPPQSPVSMQLGVQAGLSSSRLVSVPLGASALSSPSSVTRRVMNLAVAPRVEIGVAPPAYGLEAIISGGVVGLSDALYSVDHFEATVPEPRMWYAGLGIRIRTNRNR
jgi:hypothetical protein